MSRGRLVGRAKGHIRNERRKAGGSCLYYISDAYGNTSLDDTVLNLQGFLTSSVAIQSNTGQSARELDGLEILFVPHRIQPRSTNNSGYLGLGGQAPSPAREKSRPINRVRRASPEVMERLDLVVVGAGKSTSLGAVLT